MGPIAFPIGGIDDGVVRLRPYSDADLEAVAEATRDPEVTRWTRVPEDLTRGGLVDWLAEWRGRHAGGRELHLLMAEAESDRPLGAIGLNRLNDDGECDLGYWLAREARGGGVATRGVRLFCRWIFDELPVERIVIRAEPDNPASCAVAERAGFQFEGVLRSHHELKGRRRDVASYSLLRGELSSGPQRG